MLEQNNNSSEQNKGSQKTNTCTKDARRSFLKKAAIGAPIVIASSTKPAWGAACMSGMMSGNVSDHNAQCDIRSGRNPTDWENSYVGADDSHYTNNDPSKKLLNWCRGYEDQYFVVVDIDDPANFSGSLNTTNSVFQGITIHNRLTGIDEFSRQIAAAVLNVVTPNIPYEYDILEIQEIYDNAESDQKTRENVARILADIHGS
ncbi:hypothetical protein [Candidatus Colwellia aromaticivorans]|uniref:hypothetical protein n=1 Tax=Candidatus Colwellia aromaticivorans TaxID=2267621 RepID=UPI000DF12D3F|nr:hypothetical protein [Candidatus Colwellia aromaticivorans]